MDRDAIRETVLQALNEIQEMSGRSVEQIDEDTCPIGGIEGFDSLNSVEATCMLSEKFGFDVDGRLFMPDKTGEPVTIKEIVDRLCDEVQSKGGKNGRV